MDSYMKSDIYSNYSPYYSSEAYDSEPDHLSLQRQESEFFESFEQER
jgi:hypothetical protein